MARRLVLVGLLVLPPAGPAQSSTEGLAPALRACR